MEWTEAEILGRCRQLQQDLQTNLPTIGFDFVCTTDCHENPHQYQRSPSSLTIIFSTKDDPEDALDLVHSIRSLSSHHATKIILVTRYSTESRAIAAFRAGIDDYFKWPVDCADLINCVNRLFSPRSHQPMLTASPDRHKEQEIIGVSSNIQGIKNYLPKVGISDCTVLITGDTGTGKECVARQLHRFSRRSDKQFVAVDCAALPDSLLESELFGYQTGAFTGATKAYEGRLKLANGGTVFFDEIGDLSLTAQAKVLRAIETKEVTPLRSKRSSAIDFRIIAATNRDLGQLMEEKQFREDLFYRLNVARIHLPPLRERREDIGLLLAHFLQHFAQKSDLAIKGFSEEALECLQRYDWPGNVRELRNLIERLYIAPPVNQISLSDLPASLRDRLDQGTVQALTEREQLIEALATTSWNKTKAAQKLNWSRMKVYRKISKYRIQQSPSIPSLRLNST